MEVTAKNATFQKYPIYKDTGVEWLEEIPEKWEVLPSKRFHQVKKKSNSKGECDNVLSLTLRGVVNNDPDSPEGMVPKDYGTYQIFDKNNLVFKLIDLENVKTSRVGIVHEKGIMSSAYIRLIVGDENFARYTYYYFYSLYINEVYNNLGSGVRSTLGPSDLLNIPYIKPPLQEQITIAHFLDDKTTKIDRVIAQKQQMIALLKERKQIIIQNAVTKGLDPNAKMKDSGVEWIGEIPEGWEVKRLRNVFSFSKGLTITKENLQDEGIPCINYGEIHSKYGFEVNPEVHPLKCVSEEYLKDNSNSLLKRGDFIFADTSEDLEGSGNFTHLNFEGTVFAGYHTIIGRPKSSINSRFLAYVLHSLPFRNQVRTRMKGVKVFSITQSILKDLTCWYPDEKEQKKIAEYLDIEAAKIDKAIKLQEQQIEKLKELKSTLIDNAVTGKIKVS